MNGRRNIFTSTLEVLDNNVKYKSTHSLTHSPTLHQTSMLQHLIKPLASRCILQTAVINHADCSVVVFGILTHPVQLLATLNTKSGYTDTPQHSSCRWRLRQRSYNLHSGLAVSSFYCTVCLHHRFACPMDTFIPSAAHSQALEEYTLITTLTLEAEDEQTYTVTQGHSRTNSHDVVP